MIDKTQTTTQLVHWRISLMTESPQMPAAIVDCDYVNCPSCSVTYDAGGFIVGQIIHCEYCGKPFRLMSEEEHEWITQMAAMEDGATVLAGSPSVKPESGWLIESRHIDGSPIWFTGHYLDDNEWTGSDQEAIRFARKEDAEKIIRHMGWTEPKATEHMWG